MVRFHAFKTVQTRSSPVFLCEPVNNQWTTYDDIVLSSLAKTYDEIHGFTASQPNN